MTPHPSAPQAAPLVETCCPGCGAGIQFTLGTVRSACAHCGVELVRAPGSATRWIGASCPACGGPFLGIEGDDTARCPYCHSGLLIQRRRRMAMLYYPPLPRERIEARLGAGLQLVMAPYYRLRTIVLGWEIGWETRRRSGPKQLRTAPDALELATADEVERSMTQSFAGRVLHLSAADQTSRELGLPPLGIKPWVLPAQLYRPGAFVALGAQVLARSSDPQRIAERLEAQARRPRPVGPSFERLWWRGDLVRPRLDLVYAPFFRRADGTLFDGTNGIEVGGLSNQPALADPAAEPREGVIAVSLLRCPSCAADLPEARFAAASRCGACGALWQMSDAGLEPAHAAFCAPLRALDPAAAPLYLPYWKLRLDGGQNILPAEARSEASLYVPGHGDYRAPRIDFVARDLNRLQTPWNYQPAVGNRLVACFLDPSEATALAFPYYLNPMRIRTRRALDQLRALRFQPRDPELVLLPFADVGRELRALAFERRYDRWAVLGRPLI